MRKNTFYSWVLLVVVIGGLLVIYQSSAKNKDIFAKYDTKSSSTQPADNTPAGNKITFGDGVFSPSVINVKSGAMITFTNGSDQPLQIVSDPHPDHTNLPGLNSIIELKKDETYQFTFNTKGTWGYHNEASPTETGTVIVED